MARAEPTIETVQMADGRVVDFAGKRRIVKESTISDDGQVSIRLDFRNGATRTFVVPPVLLTRFAAHGAEQKLGDEAAGVENLDDAVAAIDALISHLAEGEWSKARETTGAYSGGSLVIAAIMEWKGKSREQVVRYIESKVVTEEQAKERGTQPVTRQAVYAAFRKLPELKQIIDRMEAERDAKRGANAADLSSALASGLDDL